MDITPALSRILIHLHKPPTLSPVCLVSLIFYLFFVTVYLAVLSALVSIHTPLAFNMYSSSSFNFFIFPPVVYLIPPSLPPSPSPSPALPTRLGPAVGLSVQCSPTAGLGWLSTLPLITPQQLPIYLAVKRNRGGEGPEDIMVIHLTTVKA